LWQGRGRKAVKKGEEREGGKRRTDGRRN